MVNGTVGSSESMVRRVLGVGAGAGAGWPGGNLLSTVSRVEWCWPRQTKGRRNGILPASALTSTYLMQQRNEEKEYVEIHLSCPALIMPTLEAVMNFII